MVPEASTLPSGCGTSVAPPSLAARTTVDGTHAMPPRSDAANSSNAARSESSTRSRSARAASAAARRTPVRSACAGVGTSIDGSKARFASGTWL